MKNLFFTLFFVLGLGFAASAQSAFHIAHNPVDTITTADTYDSPAHTEITNVSASPVTIKWERHEIFLTPNVTTAVCDPVTCWFSSVGSKTFTLEPDSGGQMTVHFYNNAYDPAPGQAGSGIVHIKLTNQGNTADTLTVVYTYSTLTGTKELPAANVQLFPNPSTDFFTLKNADAVGTLRLFALDGREVAQFQPKSESTYSIANQPRGTYVLALEDKNGHLFQAIELNKQ